MRARLSAWALLGDLDEFGCTYWDRAPLHQRVCDASTSSSIISLEDLDRLITSRHTNLRLLERGTYLAVPGQGNIGLGADQRTWLRDSSAVLAEFRNGRTIVVPAVHELWAPIDVLTSQLGTLLHATVKASMFVSPGGSLTDWHADDSHGVVLQVHGEKRWLVERDRQVGAPQIQPPLDVTLQPGEMLYVPQGFLHHVRGEDGVSVHVTFSCSTTTWSEVGRAVLATRLAAQSDEWLRRSVVNPEWGPRSRARWAEQVRRMIDVMKREVDGLIEDRFEPSKHPTQQRASTQDRGFLHVCDALSVTAQTAVQVRSGLQVVATTRPDVIELRFDDRCIELPAWLSPSIDLLLATGQRPLNATDLPIAPADRLVLIRRLVAEGLLQIRPIESCSP